MGTKANIFVIYAWEDNEITDHLSRHLNSINGDFKLSISHEFHINAWQHWQPYFQSHLDHTDIFLLLVSDDFMTSHLIKHPEFKSIIDRHKEGKSLVIPVIIERCPWDVDLELEGYEFNLNELHILPENGRPVGGWDSPDEAYSNIVEGIKSVLSSIEHRPEEDQGNRAIHKQDIDDRPDQEEAVLIEEEYDADETHRLWEEAEAQRRAEVKRKILEAAKASARRREEEEDRRMEEHFANKRAEEENKLREEAEAKSRAEEQRRNMEESAAERRAEDEKRRIEKAEARKRAKALKRTEKEATRSNSDIKNKAVEAPKGKSENRKKIVLTGSILVLLIVVGIWFFSGSKNGVDEELPSIQNMNGAEIEDATGLEIKNKDPGSKVGSLPELVIGDTYDGGIVFAIDGDGISGKLVHPSDAGPMTWIKAIEIEEELGEGWRLPTIEELELVYQTVGQGASNLGQFKNELYWSATPYDDYQARLLRFWDGNSSYHYNKELEHRKYLVRAIRDFNR